MVKLGYGPGVLPLGIVNMTLKRLESHLFSGLAQGLVQRRRGMFDLWLMVRPKRVPQSMRTVFNG